MSVMMRLVPARVAMTPTDGPPTTAPSNTEDGKVKREPRVGVQGFRLKKFEEAVADLLEHGIQPNFVKLPRRTSGELSQCMSKQQESDAWPFDQIHPNARVKGDTLGQLQGNRANRKEAQLRSMLRCVSAMLQGNVRNSTPAKPTTIVDFCGGTGHLAIPLALLFPECQVVVVDLKAASLKLLHEKARLCSSVIEAKHGVSMLDRHFYERGADPTHHEKVKRQCAGIPNLFSFHGSIETFQDDFDVGVALHACGEASDVVLRTCARSRASFCVSPCCVGKLHRNRRNPYIYHATSANIGTIDYPQSTDVCGIVGASQWDEVCKAADYGDMQELRKPRNATRRTAKALLETDRLLYMEQTYGYDTALTRMEPWECSPKNDILLGWLADNDRTTSPFHFAAMEDDPDCNEDFTHARRHLLSPYDSNDDEDPVDWTRAEEREVRSILEAFVDNNGQQEYVFPTGMRPRRRKLVHAIARQLGLVHWCPGKTSEARTVAVRKGRTGNYAKVLGS